MISCNLVESYKHFRESCLHLQCIRMKKQMQTSSEAYQASYLMSTGYFSRGACARA